MANNEGGISTIANGAPPKSFLSAESHATSTVTVHADDVLNASADVAPALHVSTTFRYASNPDDLVSARDLKGPLPNDTHIYSRETAPNSTRLETILQPLLHAPCCTYSSGLAAVHAAYVFLNPRVIANGCGYKGCQGVIDMHQKLTGAKVVGLDCAPEELGKGDVVHLETPFNPTGEAVSIRKYAEKAHAQGAYLLVDSTFGPPGLQEPFELGADMVMHSGTKYLGGHSDMLCGVLAAQREEWVKTLREERTVLGSVMGNMEGWLGVRSLRTLGLRVERQSANAEKLVNWLHSMLHPESRGDENASRTVVQKGVREVQHASLQHNDMEWLKEQMPNGFGSVFAITMQTEDLARKLASRTKLFHHATSLGSVESLIEWRAMSDKMIDRRLVRVSVGIEAYEDLKEDLLSALESLTNGSANREGAIAEMK